MPIMASRRAVPRWLARRIGLCPSLTAAILLALPAAAFGQLDEPLVRKTLCAKKGTGVLRVVTGELGGCRSNERRVILKVPRTAGDEGGATEPVVIPLGSSRILLPSTRTPEPAGPAGPVGPQGPPALMALPGSQAQRARGPRPAGRGRGGGRNWASGPHWSCRTRGSTGTDRRNGTAGP